jgi:DNA-binding NarL/FixJ family response regulator
METCCSRRGSSATQSTASGESRPPAVTLSRDDWAVADLLSEGLSAAQVADRLAVAGEAVRLRIAEIAAALRANAATAASARS